MNKILSSRSLFTRLESKKSLNAFVPVKSTILSNKIAALIGVWLSTFSHICKWRATGFVMISWTH